MTIMDSIGCNGDDAWGIAVFALVVFPLGLAMVFRKRLLRRLRVTPWVW